jgi:hypothetical protein
MPLGHVSEFPICKAESTTLVSRTIRKFAWHRSGTYGIDLGLNIVLRHRRRAGGFQRGGDCQQPVQRGEPNCLGV